ncbi:MULTISPECIES: gliding motility-associated C-terminal domain-containing protein [unclassified Sphingobacterium]|uniref:T9SS type B sorting domain-containing protein n=1 Tax=unclassified Sphingobacterium TaxID=2609468 RepID=UPI0025E989E2|nr:MULTISPECIES: gliding motility-associated C-terminal domain-containing protein [unclassified Sphingobacterium]
MLRLSGYILSFLVALLLLFSEATAQQGQTLHIVKGKKVTLRADAEHALSYIWFKNNEPLNGFHDQRIIVTEAGIYTVIALGEGCNSDLSDPVEIIVDPFGEDVEVNLEIRNLPDANTVMVGRNYNYQLMVLNNGNKAAHELTITFNIPREIEYVGPTGTYPGELFYQASSRQLIWKISEMEAGGSASLWINVEAISEGNAITMSKVTSRERDTAIEDNQASSTVNIVFLNIPNIITPNGDGKNDFFVIKGLDTNARNKLTVFNRMGNEVYRSHQYQNDWSAVGLNQGTYFYILEVELPSGKVHVNKGYITVIRY